MDVTNNGHLLVIDGVNKDIYDYGPGPNGVFDGRPPAGDDTVVTIDVGQYGAQDPEGIEYYPGRNTILVLDDTSAMVYELNRQGGLLNTVSIAAASPRKAAGITLAPASNGSGAQNLYIVDRGVDNDSNPSENDGRFYEMSVTLPPLSGGTNTAPVPNAGPDLTVNQPNAATLAGTINDDGLPNPPGTVTAAWSKVSGPGDVTFAQRERAVDDRDVQRARELRAPPDGQRRAVAGQRRRLGRRRRDDPAPAGPRCSTCRSGPARTTPRSGRRAPR